MFNRLADIVVNVGPGTKVAAPFSAEITIVPGRILCHGTSAVREAGDLSRPAADDLFVSLK